MRTASFVVALAALGVAGCAEGVGPGGPGAARRSLAIVEWQGPGQPSDPHAGKPGYTPGEWTSEPITAPQSVQAGAEFSVIVRTVGPNGCWRAGDTPVEYAAGEVRITPYDVHSGAQACTELLGYLPHPVKLRLDTPGEVVLRVQGRRVVNGTVQDDPTVITHRIVVR